MDRPPDNQFFKIGLIVNAPGRDYAKVKIEQCFQTLSTSITMEDGDVDASHGPAVARIYSVRSPENR